MGSIRAREDTGGHLALLKGMWPASVISREGTRFWYRAPVLSIAELLRAAGYRTAAVTEYGLLNGPVGFNHGFDDGYYEEVEAGGPTNGHIVKTFDRGIRWLRHQLGLLRPLQPPPAARRDRVAFSRVVQQVMSAGRVS